MTKSADSDRQTATVDCDGQMYKCDSVVRDDSIYLFTEVSFIKIIQILTNTKQFS